ncbi:MAG: hypothetical protein MI919_21190, partial [Holophagales bacterium]|nr:hypothetical protein [Holophagales bacterium]
GERGPMLVPTTGAGEVRIGAAERGLRVRLESVDGETALLYLVFRDAPEGQAYRIRLEERGSGRVVFESGPVAGVEHLLVLPLEQVGAGPEGPRLLRLLVIRDGVDRGGVGEEPELGGEEVLDEHLLEIRG